MLTQVVYAGKGRKKKVRLMCKRIYHVIYTHLAISDRKASVQSYLQDIETSVRATDDPDVLDRMITLLTQASTALKTANRYK